MTRNTLAISYGKVCIPIYRVYAAPLSQIRPIPESSFAGRENILFALEVDVEVFGDNFLRAYTDGDNSQVVATDSMKNFVLRQALAFDGATLEQFLAFLGDGLLQTYPTMAGLRLTGRELPFTPVAVPQEEEGKTSFQASTVLLSRSHNDAAFAALDFTRDATKPVLSAHRCGRTGLQLLKVTGSSFTHFIRDEFTTLEERVDRPLFIFLDLSWKYSEQAAMLSPNHAGYVPSEQVRDLAQVVFHQFNSNSIQQLVYEMGKRILLRFPQLSEIAFAAQNRTRDQIAVSDRDSRVKVYSDPFSAYGSIHLTMGRDAEGL